MGVSYNGITIHLQCIYQSSILCMSTRLSEMSLQNQTTVVIGCNPKIVNTGSSVNGKLHVSKTCTVGSTPTLPARKTIMLSLYIYIIASQVVINCIGVGCMSTSVSHFKFLLAAGVLETIFELPLIVRIYKRTDLPTGEEKKVETPTEEKPVETQLPSSNG